MTGHRAAPARSKVRRPPCLESRRTSEMQMSVDTALHMSYTVRAATLTAVSASISTPVFPVVRASLCILTEALSGSRTSRTPTLLSTMLWQSGMSALVCFAPMMPAATVKPCTASPQL